MIHPDNINPHDPGNYNEWFWAWSRMCDMNDENPINWGYLMNTHYLGRFANYHALVYTMDDYPTYFIFRGIAVNICEAVNNLCDKCDEIFVTGGWTEPEDRGCNHDFSKGLCKFAGPARYVEKLLLCPPGTYLLEGW